jgi:RNA polymerase sigma factor (sigma-70 family)
MTAAAMSSVSSTAQAVLALARGADQQAWSFIVEHHAADMYRTAARITGERGLAEDACQEAFLHVRSGAARFRPNPSDPDGSARAWLVRIAASCALHLLRSRRRREHHERVAQTMAPRTEASTALDDALRDGLSELPDAQRLPLVLHYFSGLDYQQISAQIGCSPGAARVRVSRAIEQLRRRLAPCGLLLSAGALANHLGAIEVVPAPANTFSAFSALLSATSSPTVPAAAVFTGVTLMTKLSLTAAGLVAIGMLAVATPSMRAEEKPEPKKQDEGRRLPGEGSRKREEAPDIKSGTVKGTVVSATDNRLVLKDENGHSESYMPEWHGGMPANGGGLDKDMVATLKTLHEGDQIEITWVWEERRRVTSVKQLGRPIEHEGRRGAP